MFYKPGDVIFREKPFAFVLDKSEKTQRCDYCLKKFDKLKRCSKCKYVYYCSENCQREDWKNFHKFSECKIYQECNLIKQLNSKAVTILDSDSPRLLLRLYLKISHNPDKWSEEFLASTKVVRTLNSLLEHKEDVLKHKERIMIFDEIKRMFNDVKIKYDEEILFSLFCKLYINAFSIMNTMIVAIGRALYLCTSVFNHSCLANAITLFHGTTIETRAIQDIDTTKQEIFINYLNVMEKHDKRSEMLQKNYYFTCTCKRCIYEKKNQKLKCYSINLNSNKDLKPFYRRVNSPNSDQNVVVKNQESNSLATNNTNKENNCKIHDQETINSNNIIKNNEKNLINQNSNENQSKNIQKQNSAEKNSKNIIKNNLNDKESFDEKVCKNKKDKKELKKEEIKEDKNESKKVDKNNANKEDKINDKKEEKKDDKNELKNDEKSKEIIQKNKHKNKVLNSKENIEKNKIINLSKNISEVKNCVSDKNEEKLESCLTNTEEKSEFKIQQNSGDTECDDNWHELKKKRNQKLKKSNQNNCKVSSEQQVSQQSAASENDENEFIPYTEIEEEYILKYDELMNKFNEQVLKKNWKDADILSRDVLKCYLIFYRQDYSVEITLHLIQMLQIKRNLLREKFTCKNSEINDLWESLKKNILVTHGVQHDLYRNEFEDICKYLKKPF